MALKLQQGQVWKGDGEFVRIVQLERLEVKYKVMRDLKSGEGIHHQSSKKEFCRLLKNRKLIPAKRTELPMTNDVEERSEAGE